MRIDDRMQGRSIVPWWSFTKTLIAALALKLASECAIDLDVAVFERATLRHLLRHESGLPDYGALHAYRTLVAQGGAPWTLQDALREIGGARLFSAGEGWSYSNIGYAVAVEALTHSTGQRLDELMRARLFAPTGCSSARLAVEPSDLTQVEGVLRGYHPGHVMHGLAIGTLDEARALLDALLHGHLLTPGERGQMLDVRNLGGRLPGRPWTRHGYGLGLMVGLDQTGRQFAGHTGGGPSSVIAVYSNRVAGRVGAAFRAGGSEGDVENAAFDASTK